jgi:hypothetical protein
MAKTITLDDVQIRTWTVDPQGQYVAVHYNVLDSTGEMFSEDQAIFWVTLPEEPQPRDYQLPPAYVQTLLDLTNDARTAIANREIDGLG